MKLSLLRIVFVAALVAAAGAFAMVWPFLQALGFGFWEALAALLR